MIPNDPVISRLYGDVHTLSSQLFDLKNSATDEDRAYWFKKVLDTWLKMEENVNILRGIK